MKRVSSWTLGFVLALAGCAGTEAGTTGVADEGDLLQGGAALRRAQSGAVFTVGNEADGNHVYAFARAADGSLGQAVAHETGGLGSGDSLGSQSALVLSEDRRFLLAVDAGSSELSSFAVDGTALELVDRVDSGGLRPISVTARRGLVYVVNAAAPANVSGFFLDRRGRLHPIAGSRASLSAPDAGPGQIELSHDGRTLIVTEKGTNVISSFAVSVFGKLGPRRSTPSAGMTPFGFELTRDDTLIVSEAASQSASSYALRGRDELRVISAAVPDTQAAPCWVAISSDDRFAYVANAGSASVSSYTISRRGEIALADARAGDLGEGAVPLDMAVGGAGRFLYVLDRGHAEITGLHIQRDGSLEPSASAGSLPAFATGLAAY